MRGGVGRGGSIRGMLERGVPRLLPDGASSEDEEDEAQGDRGWAEGVSTRGGRGKAEGVSTRGRGIAEGVSTRGEGRGMADGVSTRGRGMADGVSPRGRGMADGVSARGVGRGSAEGVSRRGVSRGGISEGTSSTGPRLSRRAIAGSFFVVRVRGSPTAGLRISVPSSKTSTESPIPIRSPFLRTAGERSWRSLTVVTFERSEAART